MAQTILVPTDLRVASLNTLKLALEFLDGGPVRAVLMYAEYLDDSITDLLFYSRKTKISNSVSSEYREALEILRNRFEAKLLGNIVIERFHGYNSNALNNFIDANKIDMVFIPKSYQLKTTSKSTNPIPLLNKLKLSVYQMEWHADNSNITEREQLTALFN
jgi:hypothetical protein